MDILNNNSETHDGARTLCILTHDFCILEMEQLGIDSRIPADARKRILKFFIYVVL